MMPYGSASSTTVSHSYDVFMSFRGEDTRKGFTSHLYDALTRNDIRTYKDDKTLEIGNPIASELLEAIETSRIAIVILSSNFATSKWCLEEIAKIADCMKRGTLDVIPIFYHVSPSDVRHQSNCFEPGFSNHEADPEIASQKVEIWRSAFRDVGAICGSHVTRYRDEVEVVSEILSKILGILHDTMPINLPNSLVGIESRVDEVKRILRMESSEVLFIGICGMSGIGKTTLAEAVYKDIKNKFEKSSLIENIKDISKQNDSSGLCKLQQKLLDDILKEKSIHVQSVIHGQTLLGTKLRGKKVIIVLDDVNHVDQLTYLAGGREWFGPGSRVIVTTTNRHLLNLYNINEIYLCEEMMGDEALNLFCQSAFRQSHPTHGYEKLSDDVVKLAGGLPLALNVYGSVLCGNDENYWKDMLKKLKKYPEEEVLGRLEVVYARLNENQRHIFIYIACFLKGRNKDFVKDVLTNIGLYSECGITDLINKCLITINFEDSVWMHDLLQQMCWKILHKESNRHDGNHIAIKYHEDIVHILSSNPKGTRAVEVINQEPYKVEVNDCFIIDPACFSKMTKLKFLRISNVHFPQGLEYLSNDLRILEWYGCSLKSLPSIFKPKHIYELEMCSSQLERLWEKDLELPNLRSINLNFSKNLTQVPNITSTWNLVKLNLEGCTNLTRLHESVLLHKRLCYLNLKGCTCLQSLGRRHMEMEALEALLLSGCSKLENIPEFGKNMKRLEHLYVDGTRIKKLPENLGEMCELRNLDASGTFIEEIPSYIYRLKKLRLLHVNRCPLSFNRRCFLNPGLETLSSGLKEVDLSYCNLSVVPDGIGLLCHLITLDLSGNEFVSLPASIGLLSKLRMLCLDNCERLQSLPKLSLVDDHDTDYGPRSRFNYYVSTKRLDVSKVPASSFNSCPTVSCLNCPKLAEKNRGYYLAERILNSYLQLREKCWMTPEAVFEIVGAGSEIPSDFVQPASGSLILEGPWIGVAICAVISVHHVDVYKETKYMVTANIHLGEKHWKIPIPINFSVADSETQLVIYWTEADNFLRIVGSSQKSNFGVSFSVEPEDSNLHVTKFGVRFIDDKYMMNLKRPKSSLIMRVEPNPKDHEWYIAACEDDTNLHHHARKIVDLVDFILGYGRQQASLDGIYRITKALLEVNQEFFTVLSGCKREWKYTQCVSSYYAMSLGASVLYNDFIRSLKDVNDGWLSVKLELEQIVVKSRTGKYSSREISEHLKDIEAPQCVGLSDYFFTVFECVFKHAYNIVPFFNAELQCETALELDKLMEKEINQVKGLAKISSITVSAVFCMMAAYIGDLEPLKELKQPTLNSLWKHLFTGGGRFIDTHCNSELQILDFYENRILKNLMTKMAGSNCFTKENDEEMTSVIDKLQMNINKLSYTIQAMSSHADKYRDDIGKARKHVKAFHRHPKDDTSIIFTIPVFVKREPIIAIPSVEMMPYGSASSTTVSHRYDVFMSFHEDTRMGFTSHLYRALTEKGIRTYKDDKTLEIGNPIASELLEAIETSRIAIVILSSNFATSKWCLEEIAKISNCVKQRTLKVIPIFYHVSPYDVRRQSNCFELGFSNHEADPEIASQKVERWRSAFRDVGAISGLQVTQYRDEAEVVSKILSNILRNWPDTMRIDLLKSLVGIESRVDEVKRILRMESSEVLFMWICGMSGIGKTTLAEAVYMDIKNKFEKSSLIENIKDISKQNDSSGLCKLQQKLLDDILKEKSIRVQSVIHGQTLLGTKLRGRKVIIVLDDVNHVDQLTYLAGGREWFGPGTRVIVTTTHIELLNYYKMSEVYFCELMKGDEALNLFCQSAFRQSHPTHGYEKLSDDVVKLAGGLPLALNVYGSLLCGKDENYWKDMLKKLENYPFRRSLEVVYGYARLNENQRHI